jgi:hypothetical protein
MPFVVNTTFSTGLVDVEVWKDGGK